MDKGDALATSATVAVKAADQFAAFFKEAGFADVEKIGAGMGEAGLIGLHWARPAPQGRRVFVNGRYIVTAERRADRAGDFTKVLLDLGGGKTKEIGVSETPEVIGDLTRAASLIWTTPPPEGI